MADDTRTRILTATGELFRRQGYNGTSLSQVSTAAPATIGSIYHFFPGGKEALAAAVIDSTGSVYRELFEAIVAESDDVVSAFVNFFEGAALVLTESDYIDPCPYRRYKCPDGEKVPQGWWPVRLRSRPGSRRR